MNNNNDKNSIHGNIDNDDKYIIMEETFKTEVYFAS